MFIVHWMYFCSVFYESWLSALKTELVVNLHEDQRALSNCLVGKRGRINQRYCTSTGHVLYNNMECSEEERNHNQTWNTLARENNGVVKETLCTL